MPLTNQPTANVLDFGADPSGVNDSRQAVQDAINSLAPGGQLVIPSGTTRCELVNQNYIEITRDITITGTGPDSIFYPTPDPRPIDVSDLFRVTAASQVVIENLTLQGPKLVDFTLNPGYHLDPGGNPLAQAIIRAVHYPDIYGPSTLTMRNIRWLGNWYSCLSIDQGAGLDPFTAEISDSYVWCYASALGLFIPNGGVRNLKCRRVVFPRSGIPAVENGPLNADGTPSVQPYGQTVYFTPGGGIEFEDCEWVASEKNAVQAFSGGGHEGVAQPQVYTNCYIRPGCKGAVLTGGADKTWFRGGRLESLEGVNYSGEVGFEGVEINCPVTAAFGPAIATVTYNDCEFGPMARIAPQGGTHQITGGMCARGIAAGAGANTLFSPKAAPAGAPESLVIVNGGVWQGGINPGEAATELICPEAGTVRMSRAQVCGNYGLNGSSGPIGLRNGSTGRVEVEDTHFDIPSNNGNMYAGYCSAGIAANSLVMRRCTFSDGIPFATDSPQDCSPCEGTRTGAVASAATVLLPDAYNYNTLHLSGTVNVAQIVVSNQTAHPEWWEYNQMCYRGRLTLIADDGLTLISGTGVGALALAAPITLAAGQRVTLEHNPATLTWQAVS